VTIRCQHLKPAFPGQSVLYADPIHAPPFPLGGVNRRGRTTPFSAALWVVVDWILEKEASCSGRKPVGEEPLIPLRSYTTLRFFLSFF
jgi:hypothetical protein